MKKFFISRYFNSVELSVSQKEKYFDLNIVERYRNLKEHEKLPNDPVYNYYEVLDERGSFSFEDWENLKHTFTVSKNINLLLNLMNDSFRTLIEFILSVQFYKLENFISGEIHNFIVFKDTESGDFNVIGIYPDKRIFLAYKLGHFDFEFMFLRITFDKNTLFLYSELINNDHLHL